MTNAARIIYFYDALCGWCYGFSGVIRKLSEVYANDFAFEVVSSGMILGERSGMLSNEMAQYILGVIPRLESMTGVVFGEAYKQQLRDGGLYQSSLKPSIYLSLVKQYDPSLSIPFAASIQHAQFANGLSLASDETYLPLLERLGLPAAQIMTSAGDASALSLAQNDFNFTKQMGINGFPALVAGLDGRYYSISNGYAGFEILADVFGQLKTMK